MKRKEEEKKRKKNRKLNVKIVGKSAGAEKLGGRTDGGRGANGGL